ncbi:MAG TPA: lytic transglycosylase domain-containing protein [Burkholderiales bacterium]|jgi:soluble lytic murein transglycosylase-like protein|nr:lytic transglycosylase domain-containing protein [Burkholderiales bacterium]
MEEASESFVRPAFRRAFSLARGALALLGLAVSFAFLVPSIRDSIFQPPVVSEVAFAVIKPHQAIVLNAAAEQAPRAQDNPEQRALAEFIARKYRVAEEAITSIVSSAYRAGAEHRVDPLLILAVVAIESRFNPLAESVFGAKGLMQIMPKYHQDKVSEYGGDTALLEPEVNIQVGTKILREYLRRSGETESALEMYLGIGSPDELYTSKVLAERARLRQLAERAKRLAASS